ncbi:hypothetical protein FSP39_015038 [Pinctada imbricata]|uniref:F-box domain-containing protein n=1 Tax=Pinctada imbricata TaxID=66713 RepID=A0AA89CAV6_PINIB|nr:hypothetical protein FSP39_015038 [Pinctada imbricata]
MWRFIEGVKPPAEKRKDVDRGQYFKQYDVKRLTGTNFSDVRHLTTLLENLAHTFQEFRAHEQIENKYIMQKLKDKLNMLSIRSTAVCNCHSDNKLSEMLQLLQDGYKCTEKSEMDRINYGLKLRSALEDFTEKFIPHMEEEEEVFQPMLMEYFSFEELKAIKSKVIRKHRQSEHEDVHVAENEDVLCESSDDDEKSLTEKRELTAIEQLPDEIMLQIFGYLNPQELVRCSGVCTQWNRLAMDGSLWKVIRPVQWAKGDWSFMDFMDVEEEEERSIRMEEVVMEMKYDEDADIDESESSDSDSDSDDIRQIQKESKLLVSMVRYLLPKIGKYVMECHLAYSTGLQNGVLYKILKLCPNIEVLDLTQTHISDIGFKSLGKNGCGSKLKKVDLSGCKSVTDSTLIQLSTAMTHASNPESLNENSRGQKVCSKYSKDKATKKSALAAQIDSVDQALKSACDWLEGNLMASRLYEMIENQRMQSPFAHRDPRLIENHQDLTSVYISALNWIKTYYPNSINKNVCSTVSHSNARTSANESLPCDAADCPSRTRPSHNRGNVGYCSDLERTSGSRSCSELTCDSDSLTNTKGVRLLEFLSLSGCYKVTDSGIRSLATDGGLPYLQHLDLSGCSNISSQGLTELVGVCPSLDHDNLFYCDNMEDDPYALSASGCQNLECRSRACCRTGE